MSFLDLCEYRNNIDRKNLLELFAMNMPLNNSKWLEQYFEKYPYDLDLLYEYVSYLVRNHIRDFVMFNDESLFSTIGRHLYHYLKGQNKVTSLNKLKKICLLNSTLLCFRQLYVILSNIEKGNLMMYPNGYWLNSYGLNFYDSVFFADKSRRQQFLKANDFFLVDDFKSNHLLNINLLRQIILLGNIQDTCIIKLLSKLLQEDVPSYLQGAIYVNSNIR